MGSSSSLAQNPPAPAGGALTIESLKGVLEGLGYEPENINNAAYRLRISRDGWNFVVTTSLSPSKEKLWLTAYLSETPDVTKLPPATLAKLLLANNDIGPAHFYFLDCTDCKVKDSKLLYIGMSLDNRSLSPAQFRKELDRFCANIKNTAEFWDVAKWTPGGNTTAAKPAK